MVRRALEPTDYPFFDYRRFTFSLGVAAQGQIWLSGSTAVRFDASKKAMVVEGDLIAQAQVIYDKMRKTLAADSLDLRHVTRMVQYVTPSAMADLPRLEAVRKELFAAAPVVSTIIVKSLLRDAALIEIEGTAAADAMRPATIAVSAEGDPAAGDIAGQCREAYGRLAKMLESAGAHLDTVMKTTEFIVPEALADYRKTADVRRDVFATPYPAATGVIVEKLARKGSLILVEAIAVRSA